MSNHKKNQGCVVIGPYDLRAKYAANGTTEVLCELRELHANGDCDAAVTACGSGIDEPAALRSATAELIAALHANA